MDKIITNIKREEHSLQVTISNEKIFIIDFTSGNILNSKGKVLENNPFSYSDVSNEIEYAEIFHYFLNSFTFNFLYPTRKLTFKDKERIRNFEKFLPYLRYIELHRTLIDLPFFPEGYIDFLEKNNLRMDNLGRELFEVEMDKSLSEKDKNNLRLLSKRKIFEQYELVWLIRDLRKDNLFRESVYNYLKNSNYTFENCDIYTLCTIRSWYRTFGIIENTNNLNLEEVIELYKAKDKEEDKKRIERIKTAYENCLIMFANHVKAKNSKL